MATDSAIRADINATLYKSFVACQGSVPEFLEYIEVALAAVNKFKRNGKKMVYKNHYKTWTKKEEVQLMRHYKNGLAEEKISDKLHRAPKAVEFHIAKCLLSEQHAKGLTIAGLAKKYKKSSASIVGSIDVGQNHCSSRVTRNKCK